MAKCGKRAETREKDETWEKIKFHCFNNISFLKHNYTHCFNIQNFTKCNSSWLRGGMGFIDNVSWEEGVKRRLSPDVLIFRMHYQTYITKWRVEMVIGPRKRLWTLKISHLSSFFIRTWNSSAEWRLKRPIMATFRVDKYEMDITVKWQRWNIFEGIQISDHDY